MRRKSTDVIFNRSLLILNKPDYGFTIDPLFDFEYGYDIRNKERSWLNTRGILIEGFIGKTVSFSSSFYENQALPPLWIREYTLKRHVIPGQGGVKGFGNEAFDFANSSGYVNWAPSKFFSFRLGHGKNFLGDGYRSMILSDFSSAYPYFMLTATYWKIKYISLTSQFSHPDVTDHTNDDGSSVYAKKYNTLHYLSLVPGKRWNISFFESVIWQSHDSSFNRGFELSYLNPVIFLRPVEFNLGSFDNEIMGLNLRFTATKRIVLYGQFVIDDMRIRDFLAGNGCFGNKYAYQAGIKTFDFPGIKNLNLRAEFNLIRPYTYSHRSPVQNYSNGREPLAHPAGANTKEAVFIAGYNYRRFYFNLKYNQEVTGLDSTGLNYGKNIFLSYNTYPKEYDNYTAQGRYTTLSQLDFTMSYLINPLTNMNIFISAILRKEDNSTMHKSYSYLSFGFRTSLRNLYYDFL
jgi:hypothetical protein